GVLRRLARPERAHQDETLDSCLARGGEDVPEAVDHDALELGGPAADERDEVDDVGAAGGRGPDARGVGDVADGEFDSPGRQRPAPVGAAHERSDLALLGPERVHDLRSDEAGRADDEDLHVTPARSSASSGSAWAPADPGTSSRDRSTRTGARPARSAARTKAGRS